MSGDILSSPLQGVAIPGETHMSPQIRGFILSAKLAAVVLAIASVTLTGCTSKSKAPEAVVATPSQPLRAAPPAASIETTDPAQQSAGLLLPTNFGHYTGDWDDIVKRGVLRVLVVYSKSGYFYDRGRARGLVPDAMTEFEDATNKKLKTGARRFKVVFIPVPPGQLKKALDDGLGDIACTGIIITPEREKLVDFTIPTKEGVKLVVVTSKTIAPINSIADLSGKDIYVNSLSAAEGELEKINQSFKQAGKPEIVLKAVDPDLTEEDMLQMVDAGLIPATTAFDFRAQLWAKVLSNLLVTPVAIKEDGDIGWAMRKGSPQLKAVMDDFIRSHGIGTAFGNMMIQRYLKNHNHLKNSTSQAEIRKLKAYVKYFQQYAAQYNFDYLMLAAQAYQESMLNQDRVSPRGAVGIMQVLPQYAAADPINIPNVQDAQNNIHAGTKMLAQITKTYFNDPGISKMDKTLFTFASYNAGQNRIVRLRKQAQEQGLDPNKWFGNVELIAAKDIGQETVQYVSNIYKYYVAYKMTIEQEKVRVQARQSLKEN
jgi:membrane-bound lytic murein transglycosylase MltF